MNTNYASLLRAFRRQQGLTMQELANAAKISLGQLSDIERGRSQPPLATFDHLLAALGKEIIIMAVRCQQCGDEPHAAPPDFADLVLWLRASLARDGECEVSAVAPGVGLARIRIIDGGQQVWRCARCIAADR